MSDKHYKIGRACNWPEYEFLTDTEALVLDEISDEVFRKAGVTLQERKALAKQCIALVLDEVIAAGDKLRKTSKRKGWVCDNIIDEYQQVIEALKHE